MSTIPIGRGSTPADVANACCYLASDEAEFITGVDLEVSNLSYITALSRSFLWVLFSHLPVSEIETDQRSRLMVGDVFDLYQ